ncbi:homeobox-DDT domain protein RLT3-like [Iris pallida]|uniref:Homeobox-DDT domain protein RLT3-like n=1 Tax=Iris pallida TaxID=29817 RepID=A0AAX6EDA9_IRIPA|nr:homeobox-DDT domain protein RLT3-like [Iris pallida]
MDEDVLSKKKHHGTKKKTPFQLQSLEKYYSEEKYPKHKDMEDYAASLNLTYKQIRIWFVERRRKEKRENEVHGCCKSLQGGRSVQKPSTINVGKQKPDESTINVGKQANYSLGQSGLQSQAKSKNNIAVNPKSYQLKDDMLLACNGRTRHKEKRTPPPESYNRSSSSQERRELHTSMKYDRATKSKRKYYSLSNNQHVNQTTNCVLLQDLFSKDYILKRLFRKDGPPLGAEFDSLPTNAYGASGSSADSAVVQDCRDSQRISKRRKYVQVLDSANMESGILHTRDAPTMKYGIGKGLMTMLRAANFDNLKRSSALNFVDGSADLLRTTSSLKDTLCGASKAIKQPTLVPKRSTWRKKSPEKKKPPLKRKKVQCKKDTNQNKPHRTTCILSTEANSLKQPDAFIQYVDDEELELRELQAGPNPLRCSAHLTSNGTHNCPLCKDLLARFPPTTIMMKQPLCTRPWASSQELVKKLIKVLRFLYNIATTVELCPFTINELAQAFTDKDSMLLGKIHVTLLNYLLFDVQRELSAGMTPRASKDGRFLGFLQFIREQECDVNFWSQSLNPLTWTEILRQVLVAAGFGSKPNITRRDSSNKDKNLMTKYGLRPRTLKGELFGILFEQGYGGLKVTEIAKASQIVALDLPHTKEELEQLICSTLSSDITLFEKIAPFAYRLRSSPHIEGEEDYQSDSEDSGSVDDDSGDCSTSSSDDDNMDVCKQKTVKFKSRRKQTAQKLTKYTEIDESFSGEAWVLGLMEGEYSNLSVDEKLDALIALVDLAGAGSSLRMEETIRATSVVIPNIQYHGSGAKIKKSSVNHQLVTQSSAIFSEASGKDSFQKFSTAAKDKSRLDAHPMQSIHLGSDRRYNSYWLFLGPCDANDPGHRRVYLESSEDGHWDVIDTTEGLEALLSALDCRGTREARLVASLDKRVEFLCQAMDDHMTSEGRQTRGCDPSEVETSSGSGSSPISDVDNILGPVETMNTISSSSGDINLELGGSEEKKHRWDRLQSFDKWIWNAFYCNLNAVKKSKRSYMESLARCGSCHDLYWRDEKHCMICHTTFELDFDLEERYAIHVATCKLPEESSDFPQHKVLPSQLQALKAAIHAIEASIPEVALSGSWTRSGHKLWAKRLRRTSSLPELLQVLSDFVGAINEEWLYESNPSLGSNTLDEILVYFQTMPQTTSAVALWMVKLDFLIAPHLENFRSNQVPDSRPQSKRRHACTK